MLVSAVEVGFVRVLEVVVVQGAAIAPEATAEVALEPQVEKVARQLKLFPFPSSCFASSSLSLPHSPEGVYSRPRARKAFPHA